jgi:hypothetical protein
VEIRRSPTFLQGNIILLYPLFQHHRPLGQVAIFEFVEQVPATSERLPWLVKEGGVGPFSVPLSELMRLCMNLCQRKQPLSFELSQILMRVICVVLSKARYLIIADAPADEVKAMQATALVLKAR